MASSGFRIVFPFTALVDQERLKTALILNAINPRIGGVLIRGAKGTGKSTAVRALVDLLPQVTVVGDCPFHCSPEDPTNMCEFCSSRVKRGEELPVDMGKMRVVDLPIGATEDRVVGTLSIEKAIREGVRALEAGILAEANQNVLYVDEVNLLPDHITDVILDAAASGWNTIEREGISVSHPSRFILIGTMNPEEGELRPQLLDRMALHTEILTVRDPKLRTEIIRLNMEFEDDPVGFRGRFKHEQETLLQRILAAKETLYKVIIPDQLFDVVARMCIALDVDGHRPDIIMIKSARTLAAFNGRLEVEPKDLLDCAYLALSHRTRNLGMDPPPSEGRARVREMRAPVAMVLLLDMSESMVPALVNVRNAVLSMHDILSKKRSQVGLVIFKGQGAVTLQRPTSNLGLVAKKLMEVGASDLTPLASGMFEARRILRNEKVKNRDTIPVLVIISDGITNVPLESPVSMYARPRFLNKAQADVVDVAQLLQREGIRSLVINPSHTPPGSVASLATMKRLAERAGKRWMEPTELLLAITEITGGWYYGIGEEGELEEVILTEALGVLK